LSFIVCCVVLTFSFRADCLRVLLHSAFIVLTRRWYGGC
jgi:hypothetical protein